MGEASRLYFGKSVRHLELHESALIAAIIQSPNANSPFRNPDRAVERRNLVLDLMQRQGRISNLELAESVGLSPTPCSRRVKRLEDSGLIRAHVTLLDQANQKHVLLRSEIKSLQSTGRSLMVDGLEAGLSHQDLADLIAYLRAAKK